MARARILAAVAVVALAGCGGGRPSLDDVLADPDEHRGESLTFEGQVSNPIDHRVWEMADGRLFVIYDRGLDRGLAEGERLRVSGTVRALDKKTIEGEHGVNIEDHFFTDDFLADDVAFLADSVDRLGEPG